MDIAYVNDSAVIRQNPKVTAINNAVEIDLTGQICADSIRKAMYSGVGGQMDFIRGASLSEGGKPIIALGSTTHRGEFENSIYAQRRSRSSDDQSTRPLRGYGVADLYGKNLSQRARVLTDIAHPDHREALEKERFERFSRM